MNNNQRRGISIYFILILLVAAMLIIPGLMTRNQVIYSRTDFENDLSGGNVVQATISPGKVSPTGEAEIVLVNGTRKTLYIT